MQVKKNIAISESGFLFNPTSGDSYSLNPTGTFILNLLKDHTPIEEVKQLILQEYDVDEANVEKDLYDFITVLKNYKIIEHA